MRGKVNLILAVGGEARVGGEEVPWNKSKARVREDGGEGEYVGRETSPSCFVHAGRWGNPEHGSYQNRGKSQWGVCPEGLQLRRDVEDIERCDLMDCPCLNDKHLQGVSELARASNGLEP